MDRKLQVEAIHNGSVIDHIPAGQGVKILKFFQLAETQERITIGLNLPSSKQGRKDLIKIENTLISDAQANQLALFAPGATVNLIENLKVVKKFEVALPEQMEAVLSCPNSNCITHIEPIESRFYVRQQQEKVKLRCHYCEKSFTPELFKELSS